MLVNVRIPTAWYMLVTVLVCLSLLQVWLAYERNQVSANIGKSQHSMLLLQRDVNVLRLELANLSNPENLRQQAVQRGMQAPNSTQILKAQPNEY
ncbi:MAG: hypothetical protein R8K21_01360 [Mariprofundales bacterium]